MFLNVASSIEALNAAILNLPVVNVPVLSNTTCLIDLNISKLFAFLNSIPFLAPRPKPTATAAGVANPIAHGQLITKTAILRNKLCPKGSPTKK